jgi:predicted ribosome quality control (RQC) complex YloA/Tae2 family protein
MKIEIFNYKDVSYTIYIGGCKEENWKLIDESFEYDVWFHVADKPSCHVILKNQNSSMRSIPHQVIKRCAYLCKICSKLPTCNVNYTQIKNIKKAEHIGSVYIMVEPKSISI